MQSTIAIDRVVSRVRTAAVPLGKFFSELGRILAFSPADDMIFPKRVAVITIGRTSFSVTYASRFLSKLTVHDIRTYPAGEGPFPQPDTLASSTAVALQEMGAQGADVIMSVPKMWCIARVIEFPSTVRENLSNVVSYELDRYTPLTSDDACFDHQTIGENALKLPVLVAAAKSELINPYINAFTEKGIRVGSVTLSLSCAANLCSFLDRKAVMLYLDIGGTGYEGTVCRNGIPLKVFSGTLLPNTGKDPAESLIHEAMQAGAGNEPERVVISVKDQEPAFRECLRTAFKVPVKFLDEIILPVKFRIPAKNVPPAALGGVIGSLRPRGKLLNLLSMGRHEVPSVPKLLTGLLLIIFSVLFCLYTVSPIWIEEQRLKEIDSLISQKKGEARKVETLRKEVQELSAEVASIDLFRKKKPLTINMIKDLTTILPKTAWLTRVRLSESTAEIEGYATSATELLQKLETSPYFQKVEFASPTFRDARMNADRFVIKMEIEGIQKTEPEKPKSEKPKTEKPKSEKK